MKYSGRPASSRWIELRQIDPDGAAVHADVALLNGVMIDAPVEKKLHLFLLRFPVIGKRDLLAGLADDLLGRNNRRFRRTDC